MKVPTFAIAASFAWSLNSLAADGGQVTLSLADYLSERRIAAEAAEGDRPLIGEAISRATVTVDVAGGKLAGRATFAVATYSAGWHVVPLIGGPISVLGISPEGASLVTHEGRLALQVKGELREDVVVNFESVLPGGEGWTLDFPGVVSGMLTVEGVPEGMDVALASAEGRVVGRSVMLSSRPSRIEIAVTAESRERELPQLETDTATVSLAEYQTRIVADGSLLCEARVKVQHRDRVGWKFEIPADSQLLTCSVAGVAARPVILESGGLEVPLAKVGEKGDAGTMVTFSYTAEIAEFDPVRGDFQVGLPTTPLFVERIDWQLALPDGYEASAFEGNVEVSPDAKEGPLQFQKSLVRGAAPSVQIFYTKAQLR